MPAPIAARVMFEGMTEGWFRTNKTTGKPETLAVYFNDARNDSFTAREIINGDKSIVPGWSCGVSIGNLTVGYHAAFLAALQAAWDEVAPSPPLEPEPEFSVSLTITISGRGPVNITVAENR